MRRWRRSPAGPTCRRPPSCCRRRDAEADYRCASSRPSASCRSPAIPRSAAATPGSAAGGRPRSASEVIQECGVGLVRVRRDGARLAFAAPPLRRSGPLEPELLARIVSGLSLQPRRRGRTTSGSTTAPAGARCACSRAARVLAAEARLHAAARHQASAWSAPHPARARDVQFEVRALIGQARATKIRSPAASTPASRSG